MDDLGSQKEEVVKLRATITQQAQELEQAKGNYAIQKAAADDYEQQLAASQARCRELEAVRHDYKATLTDAELSDKEYMTAYCSDFHADYGLALKRLAELEATLAALVEGLPDGFRQYVTKEPR